MLGVDRVLDSPLDIWFQAVVARSLVVGQTDSPSLILAASRAVPVVAVSDLQSVELFVAWVRTAINYKEPKDLKGNKCGTPRLGGVAHAYCLALAKKFGLEKDIKTISVGGIPQIFAALKTGAIDLAVEPTHLMIRLKESGDIKVLATISELVPKGLPGHWVFADRGFASSNPATVKNLVKATLQATSFLRANGDWAAAKMVSVSNFTPVAAREIFKDYRFARDGRISKAAIENLESFLVEYNVMAKEKTPAVDAVYTERFLP